MYYSLLADRGVLSVSGADAREFLQGIITNDIHKATEKQAIFAALLSPQGKFLYDFFVTRHEGKLLLETDKARLPELKKRLMMYRLRSKVDIEERPELAVAALWDEEKGTRHEARGISEYVDPRLPDLGSRVIYNLHEVPTFVGTIGGYDHHRLSLGVPEGSRDLIPDRSLLLEYGYDELHGVDFAKGCYVGQEVTARSKHRATLRKFIHQVEAIASLPPAGTPVTAGGREVGVMASSSGNIGLALLRVEEAERAGITLEVAGILLRARLPAWCATLFQRDAK